MQIKTTAHLKCGVLNRTKRDPEFSLELKYIVLSLYDILFIYVFQGKLQKKKPGLSNPRFFNFN